MTLERYSEIPDETRLLPVDDEPDACDVKLIDGDVVWTFHFTRVQPTYSQLHANVGVDWEPRPAGMLPQVYPMPRASFRPQHVDWRSGSSKETLERRLRNYYDPGKKQGLNFSRLIEFAAGRLDEFVMSAGDLEMPTELEAGAQLATSYLVRPIWPLTKRPTIWYGQGEAGKGVLAIGVGFALCYGRAFCNLTTSRLGRGLVYVDYEDDYGEFNRRINRYGAGLELPPLLPLRRFDPMGRLFVDVVHTLKAKVDSMGGTDGYIIDSAIPACGGDVLKPEPVGAFFQALALLNKPAIVIAHEVKESPTSAGSPFGSQLWRTLSALTVNFQGSTEPRKDLAGNYIRDLVISCTKSNSAPRFSPLAFQLQFSPDDREWRSPEQINAGTPSAWTRIQQMNPVEVSPDLQGRLSPLQQIVGVLRSATEGVTVKALIEATGLSRSTINYTLGRDDAPFFRTGGGTGRGNEATWWLRSSDNGRHA